MQLFASLAVFAAAIMSVNAAGKAIIQNNCAFDVYMWAVDAQRNPQSPTVIKSGGSYSEPYATPSFGGVSLKLSLSSDNTYVTQFEYTLQQYAGTPFIWYDGSDVDCKAEQCPFWNYGIDMVPSISSCPSRSCPINEICSGFYTYWNNDINSLSCDDSASVTMTLCTVAGASGSSSSAYSKAHSSAGVVAKVAENAAPKATTTSPATTASAAIMNEAVVTTFVTEYTYHTKRAPAVHHNHMRVHEHRAAEQ